jgi:hypothetical protein
MPDFTITVRNNGPLPLEGDIAILDQAGNGLRLGVRGLRAAPAGAEGLTPW